MKLYFSKQFKNYIGLFESNRAFCEKYDIDEGTLSNILAERREIPSSLIAKITEMSGMDFEKAFEVKE